MPEAWYPAVLPPTVKFGFVIGPRVRLERNGGGEFWVDGPRLFVNQHPVVSGGQLYGVTHLQKRSWLGFLWMKPFVIHVWLGFKQQETDAKGNWVPGTEFVLYGRTPGDRWDAGDRKYIKTKGFIPQGHWD